MRVLLVESDHQLAQCLTKGLRRQGFEVDHVTTGTEALRSCPRADVVLLDLGVPDVLGVRLCHDIRTGAGVPVVAVSADGTEATRVRALRAGADDCLDKPYGFRELLARIEAVTRRSRTARPGGVQPGRDGSPVSIDVVAREARVGERCLALTEKEFDLLHLLVSHAGTVVSRDQIMLQVWGEARNRRSRTVDTHVASLRRKLGDDHRWIVTVRGVGFCFSPPGRPTPVHPVEPAVGTRPQRWNRPGGRGTGGATTAEPLRSVHATSRLRDRPGRERHPHRPSPDGLRTLSPQGPWPPAGR
ncbi:response regulator transcription factor [Streptomyces sp. NPDC001848]|uniref:response regulator transcription factor n=1 Tax=Streptomyces sp. NPDC001848 TaxID=3364618 RepID=UPI0036BD9511